MKQQNKNLWSCWLFCSLLSGLLSLLAILPLQAEPIEEEHTATPFSPSLDSIPTPTVSLLIVPPRDEAIYTIYGHAAIRIQGGVGLVDRVYNYGVFDYDAPNFTAKFIAGRTDDYMLAAQYTADYVHSYTEQGCDVYELVLNLKPEEARKVEALLMENALPENAKYRYNVVYDNCATRPVAILENAIQGRLLYPEDLKPFLGVTWRRMIDHCSSKWAWLKLGTDLALGMPADETIEVREQVFLPLYLLDIIRYTRIVDEQGVERKLVLIESSYIRTAEPSMVAPTPFYLHPGALAALLLIGVLVVCAIDRKGCKGCRIFYAGYFTVLGLVGSVLFFLSFLSLHPLTWPNLNLISLHPLHLFVGVPFILFAPYSRWSYWYHLINIGLQLLYVLLIVFAGWQTPNLAPVAWALGSVVISLRLIVTGNLKKIGDE